MDFEDTQLVRIDVVPLSGISVENEFFDSLRVDYQEFDEWFRRVASEGRKAWVVDTGTGSLDTLCIFKVESEGEPINDEGATLSGNFLKLCTLKVTKNGMRYGERLLYAAFRFAVANRLTHVYAQVRKTGHERIKQLLKRFGFVAQGSYRNDETYVKEMTPGPIPFVSIASEDNFNYVKLRYPYHLDGGAIRKFIVSLDPGIHEHLFPDTRIRNLPLEAHDSGLAGEVNAIRKAIAQDEIFEGIRVADLLLFYRQATDATFRGYIDHLGVVESIEYCATFDDIHEDVRECLPYTDQALKRMIAKGKGVQIVVFRVIQNIRPGIKREVLTAGGFDTHHRRVRRIRERLYQELIKPALLPYGVSRKDSYQPGA